ncbi:MAG: DNA-binding protein [Acidobacteria bacterium]|nr:MAG: DNA-binding protein [Acidobacteriota bacterium]
MPEKQTIEKAKRAKRSGKAPTTQASEFVREEMHHVREGKHGARSTKQAIAIGLSKARSAGVELPPPEKGKTSERTRRSAEYALRRSRSGRKPSARRAGAILTALRREGRAAASRPALAAQAHSAARRRGAGSLKAAARKAVRTKGPAGRVAAARKAARTRARKK